MHQGQIWWDIAKEAARNTNADLKLAGGWGHWMTPILLYAIYIVLVWGQISAEEASVELHQRLLLLAAPLLIYPFWWVGRLLRTIPEREQRLVSRIGLLHRYLVPRLDFEFLDGGAPSKFAYGDSHTTQYGGNVVSVIQGHNSIICGIVRNKSAKEASHVTARFVELVGDNGKRLRDPIGLHWSPPNDGATESATVPAGGERTLQLFRVACNGEVYFARAGLPIEYQHFFAGGRNFTGKIAIEEIYHASMIVHFSLALSDEPRAKLVHCSAAAYRTPEEYERELAQMEPGQHG